MIPRVWVDYVDQVGQHGMRHTFAVKKLAKLYRHRDFDELVEVFEQDNMYDAAAAVRARKEEVEVAVGHEEGLGNVEFAQRWFKAN